MLKALIWKEWREQRNILFAGLAVVVSVPILLAIVMLAINGGVLPGAVAEAVPDIFGVLIWPAFAALLGAGTFANEGARGTLEYLGAKPVPRARVWTVKVGAAAGAWFSIAAASLAVSFLLQALDGVGARDMTGIRVLGAWSTAAPALAFLFFSAAVWCSGRTSRPIAAAAIGATLALVVMGVVRLVWALAQRGLRLDGPISYGPDVALLGAVLLFSSLFRVARSELGPGGGRAAVAAGGTSILVVALALAVGPQAMAQSSLSPANGNVYETQLANGGETLVFAVGPATSRERTQIWSASITAAEATRLSAAWRIAMHPFASPDGEQVAYLSRSPVQRFWNNVDLWIVNADGSSRRRIAADIEIPGVPAGHGIKLAFSPDGESVALIGGAELHIVATDGSGSTVVDLSSRFGTNTRLWLVGWNENGSDVLVFAAWRAAPAGAFAELVACEREAGSVVSVYTEEDRTPTPQRSFAFPRLPARVRHLPIYSRRASGIVVDLIDTTTGAVTRVTDDGCPAEGATTADGSHFYYLVCAVAEDSASNGAEAATTEVHRLDLDTGADEMLAEIDGQANYVLPGAGGRVAVRLLNGRHRLPQVVILETGGSGDQPPRLLPVFSSTINTPLGWTADGHLLLAQGDYAPFDIVDPLTGETTRLEIHQE